MKQIIRFNNKNVILPEPIIIPADKYIHQTGGNPFGYSAYGKIDLDYIPTAYTSVKIKFCWLEPSATAPGDNYAFGINADSELYNPNQAYGMRIRTNTAPDLYWEPAWHHTSRDQAVQFDWNSNQPHIAEFLASFSQEKHQWVMDFKFDGEEIYQADGVIYSGEWDRSLYIFTCNTPSQYASSNEFAVSEITILENSQKVRHYIASETTYNGINTGALYEEMEGKYYYPTYLNSDEFYPYMEYVEIEKEL